MKFKEIRQAVAAAKAAAAPPTEDSLEACILYLAERCDGASSQDRRGFNGCDTGYGHWLADRILSKKPIIRKWAESAHRMLQKYSGQLGRGNVSLPPWDAIAERYPEEAPQAKSQAKAETDYRIEMKQGLICLHSPYGAIPTDNFKSVPGWEWDREGRQWLFPKSQLLNLQQALGEDWNKFDRAAAIDAAIEQIEAERLLEAQAIAEASHKVMEAAQVDRPLTNGRILFAHQQEAVRWLLLHSKEGTYRGGILADQMGLGKTCSALVAARGMVAVHECPVLVVCPASLKDNWLREAEAVGVAIEVFSWAKLPKALESQPYLLIADEAHYAQNLQSARTKAFLELADSPNCLAAWMLTGTPMKNGRPVNLYPLLLAAKHPIAADRLQYQQYYCAAHHKSVGYGKRIWDVSGAAHLNELAKKTESVILRRTKAECLDLPGKIRQIEKAEVAAATAKTYSETVRELVSAYRQRIESAEPEERERLKNAEALVTMGALRRAGSIAKVEAAIAKTEELLEQDESVVLFTEFVESAQALHTALGGELLTGETPVEKRQAMVDRFQNEESRVFVSTIRAGGVGITLTAASYIILVDRPWTPGDAEQAEDRCHRIGQKSTVNAIWLQYGQIDPAIDQLLESKAKRIELVLAGKRKTLRGLDSPLELAKELLEVL